MVCINKQARVAIGSLLSVLIITLACILFFFVQSTFFVSAYHNITTSNFNNSFNTFEVGVSNIYNITINNSDLDYVQGNITEVNITIFNTSSSARFISDSNATSAVNSVFSNTSNVLRWTNLTQVVPAISRASFWFNAIFGTPGSYNFTVSTVNATGTLLFYKNLTTLIVDTNAPNVAVNFPVNGANYSKGSINFSLSTSDHHNLNNISICRYSLTSGLVNLTMTENSSGTGLGTGNSNFNATNASIGDGTYTVNFYCNDTSNNFNRSAQFVFVIDTVAPTTIALNTPISSASAVESSWTFNYNVSESNPGVNCSLMLNNTLIDSSNTLNQTGGTNSFTETGLTTGVYTWNVTCTDTAGNFNTSETRSFTVAAAAAAASSGSGGSGSSGLSYWTNTQTITSTQVSTGYTKDFYVKYRLGFPVSNTTHYLGLVSLTSTTATVNVSSTPQQAVLSIGDVKKFDVTSDNYYDVSVKLNSITGTIANITIMGIHEAVPTTVPTTPTSAAKTTSATTETPPTTTAGTAAESIFTQTWFWVVVFIIIIVIVVLVIYLSKRKRYYKKGY